MKNIDTFTHVRGESTYLDDIPVLQGTLYGAVYGSPVAHGKISKLDVAAAEQHPGVQLVITCRHIPGRNQIGGIVPDEPLLADNTVHYVGMPIAMVVADSTAAAYAALSKIVVDIEALPIVTDARQARALGELIVPPRTFTLGNTAAAWQQCQHIFEGTADTNGQEHLYIETQGAYAVPVEQHSLKVYSSTQGPTAVQRHMADVLGLPMHRIEVEVTRLGGGFGGKEDQATSWAIFCGLAAWLLKRPVKYCLHRLEDMRMTGKRNPYTSDFKIGLDKDLNILAYEVTFHQNAGAAADLSPAVLERTLFHATNSYYIPNVLATAYSCRTNLPPNTAFRGFGGPQGMFVIEAAITTAADALGIPAWQIQKRNLLRTGHVMPYGQIIQSEANECWQRASTLYNADSLVKAVADFNHTNVTVKKGLSFMPVCFGISFTKTLMNQARALVHVYTDGSVGISTGAVEMGQGVNTKMLQVAAGMFSIDTSKIKLHSTNTFRIANTSPSAASATADLNGRAVQMACEAIVQRLLPIAAELAGADDVAAIGLQNNFVTLGGQQTTITWEQLVLTAYIRRIGLSEHAHYATPQIHYDASVEKGHPFAYHVFGTAITQVTLDCVRGTYTFDWVKIVHDFGNSMNPQIDRGQVEGGLVQGMGWMTMEEIVYDEQGRLRSNSLSTYKVPDIYSAPGQIEIDFLQTDADNPAILKSKAVGEPPLMYGIGAFFAIRNAIKAFNPAAQVPFSAPATPEKVLLALYANKNETMPVAATAVLLNKQG